MIKTLWFVVTAFGQITVTAGPLSYDVAECLERSRGAYENIVGNINRGVEIVAPNGQIVTVESIMVGCFMLEGKPLMGSYFPNG